MATVFIEQTAFIEGTLAQQHGPGFTIRQPACCPVDTSPVHLLGDTTVEQQEPGTMWAGAAA